MNIQTLIFLLIVLVLFFILDRLIGYDFQKGITLFKRVYFPLVFLVLMYDFIIGFLFYHITGISLVLLVVTLFFYLFVWLEGRNPKRYRKSNSNHRMAGFLYTLYVMEPFFIVMLFIELVEWMHK